MEPVRKHEPPDSQLVPGRERERDGEILAVPAAPRRGCCPCESGKMRQEPGRALPLPAPHFGGQAQEYADA